MYTFQTIVIMGSVFALCSASVLLTFRYLGFPDFSIDGVFALGAAVAAVSTVAGLPVAVSLGLATGAAFLAGLLNAFMLTGLRIAPVLVGILSLLVLYSINARIASGGVSLLGADTAFDSGNLWRAAASMAGLASAALALVAIALATRLGYCVRTAGEAPRLAEGLGIARWLVVVAGTGCASSLAGLAGAMFAHRAGYADVMIGTGVVVTAVAGFAVGETAGPARPRPHTALVLCAAGALFIQGFISASLRMGVRPTDTRAITAVIAACALSAMQYRRVRRLA